MDGIALEVRNKVTESGNILTMAMSNISVTQIMDNVTHTMSNNVTDHATIDNVTQTMNDDAFTMDTFTRAINNGTVIMGNDTIGKICCPQCQKCKYVCCLLSNICCFLNRQSFFSEGYFYFIVYGIFCGYT